MTQRILKGFVLLTAAVMMTACKDDTERGDSYISFGLSSDYSDIYMNRRLGDSICRTQTTSYLLSLPPAGT